MLPRRRPMAPLEGVRLAKHARPIDSTRARRELGWDPGPIADAVKRTVDWLHRHGLVPTFGTRAGRHDPAGIR